MTVSDELYSAMTGEHPPLPPMPLHTELRALYDLLNAERAACVRELLVASKCERAGIIDKIIAAEEMVDAAALEQLGHWEPDGAPN